LDNWEESGRFGAVKSDPTHHFFGNACTKSRSLRCSQFSGCWLICLVVYLWVLTFPLEDCSVILLLPLFRQNVLGLRLWCLTPLLSNNYVDNIILFLLRGKKTQW